MYSLIKLVKIPDYTYLFREKNVQLRRIKTTVLNTMVLIEVRFYLWMATLDSTSLKLAVSMIHADPEMIRNRPGKS